MPVDRFISCICHGDDLLIKEVACNLVMHHEFASLTCFVLRHTSWHGLGSAVRTITYVFAIDACDSLEAGSRMPSVIAKIYCDSRFSYRGVQSRRSSGGYKLKYLTEPEVHELGKRDYQIEFQRK